MAAIILPRKHYTQPQGRVSLSGASGDNLVVAYSAAQETDFALTPRFLARTSAVSRPEAAGIADVFSDTAGQGLSYGSDSFRLSGGNQTLICVADVTARSAMDVVIGQRSGAPHVEFVFNATNLGTAAAGRLSFCASATPTFSEFGAYSDTGIILPGYHCYGASRNGASAKFYRNGSFFSGSTTVGVAPTELDQAGEMVIGRIGAFGGTGFNFLGGLALVLCWNRALSEGEMEAFTANPWQLFRADPHRIYSLPPVITIPTLSLPGVIDIGTTSARPQVTLTY